MELAKFKLICDKDGRYFECTILDTEVALFKQRTAVGYTGNNGVLAYVGPWSVKGDRKSLGSIVFCRKAARRSAIVSHEMTHAAIEWARRKRFNKWAVFQIGSPQNEAVCWTQGKLVGDFWKRWWKLREKKVL